MSIIWKRSEYAIGSVHWQIVRQISTDSYLAGALKKGEPIEFAGNTLSIRPRPDMAAMQSRTGIDFVREKSDGSMEILGKANGLDGYQTGSKVQSVAYSGDLSRVYVGGNKGQVYVIDTLSFKLIDTLKGVGVNITSLAASGNLLLIGEGNNYGGSNFRLLALDINPGSRGYHDFVGGLRQVQGTGIEESPLGAGGMVVGPDGRTLVLSLPRQSNNSNVFGANAAKQRGDIRVIDLDSMDELGHVATPVKAVLPSDGISGKSGQIIRATQDADRYLIGHVMDYSRGLGTLVLTRDDQGKVTGAKTEAIRLNQPSDQIHIDRLDIQRAQSAVLVKYLGVEYAIVGDDNYHHNDPYWKAMYEVPMFLTTPAGFPIAFGGSVNAKKVAVGGKLGIVRDPFGEKPEFIGATLPLDGYGIVNLAVSEDGKALIGQLKGLYSGNMADPDYWRQKPSHNVAWKVETLLAKALEHEEKYRDKGELLKWHIALPPDVMVDLPLSGGMPVGVFFDPEDVQVSAEGRMGDVIGVDLKELAAKQLLATEYYKRKEPRDWPYPFAFTNADAAMSLEKLALTVPDGVAKVKAVRDRMLKLSKFRISPADFKLLTQADSKDDIPSMRLIAEGSGKDSKVLSRQSAKADTETGLKEAKFEETGILFIAPRITEDDEKDLRAGKTLKAKWGQLQFSFEDASKPIADRNGQCVKESSPSVGLAWIAAKDYATAPNTTFFGDRPLDNPGYSKFLLKGDVKEKSGDSLDVYRVEQRLRYLGYGLENKAQGLGEITVNGALEAGEKNAFKLFEKVVRYNSGNSDPHAYDQVSGNGVGTSQYTSAYGLATATISAKTTYSVAEGLQSTVTVTAKMNTHLYRMENGKKVIDKEAEALEIKQTEAAAKALENGQFNPLVQKALQASEAAARAKAEENVRKQREKDIEDSRTFAPDRFGADGVLEKTSEEGKTTLDWLNAFNAPHWMKYSFDDKTLKGWADKSEGKNQGASWIYDLMQSAQKSAEAQGRGKSADTKLWFNGTGELGSELNLGINEKYISKGNQKQVDGDEYLFGLRADNGGITSILNPKTWDYNIAQALSELLQNPNRAKVGDSSIKSILENAQGINNQKEALKDFLSIYTAMRSDGVSGNGSWDEQLGWIRSASTLDKQKIIQKALFGDGTQAGGLIDNNNLLLGGLGDHKGGIGAKLTKESLGAIMGVDPGAVADWVDPINDAMRTFDISTPKRLAAFLANVYKETGQLKKLAENTNWKLSDPNQRIGHFKKASAAILTQYANKTPDEKADYAYGNRPDMGNTQLTDGHKYKGRGLIHLTWKKNYQAATDALNAFYGPGTYDLVTNYEKVSSNETVAAMAGAFFWQSPKTTAISKNLNRVVDNLSSNDRDNFRETVKGVNGKGVKQKEIDERTTIWEGIKNLVYDQNAYGNMNEALKALGITANQKKDYNTQFGIALNRRAAQEIVPSGGTKQPPAKAGGFELRTESPDTRRLNDAS